jgi:hypothetical protein
MSTEPPGTGVRDLIAFVVVALCLKFIRGPAVAIRSSIAERFFSAAHFADADA